MQYSAIQAKAKAKEKRLTGGILEVVEKMIPPIGDPVKP